MKKLLVVLFLLSSCQSISMNRYEDIPKDRFILWNDIFNFKNQYYVYIFSYTCPHCLTIEKDIIKFYLKHSDIVYFIEYNNEIPLTSFPYSSLGVNEVNNLAIKGVPTLFKIENQSISSVYFGTTMIKDLLNSG